MRLESASCFDPHQLEEGIVLTVDKPLHWTSFDVVKKLKASFLIKKVGHAGTLDPLATGLLIICTGKKTKSISHYQDLKKTYTGEMILGKTTPSIDLETAFDSEKSCKDITEAAIHKLVPNFLGLINQVPPTYSAIKIQGERAYKKARKGQKMNLAPRQVFIQDFQITFIDIPLIRFEVICSKGTYIRSLVRDFGQRLGVGAYLNKLCRTRIGDFRLEEAYGIDDLIVGAPYSGKITANKPKK